MVFVPFHYTGASSAVVFLKQKKVAAAPKMVVVLPLLRCIRYLRFRTSSRRENSAVENLTACSLRSSLYRAAEYPLRVKGITNP